MMILNHDEIGVDGDDGNDDDHDGVGEGRV